MAADLAQPSAQHAVRQTVLGGKHAVRTVTKSSQHALTGQEDFVNQQMRRAEKQKAPSVLMNLMVLVLAIMCSSVGIRGSWLSSSSRKEMEGSSVELNMTRTPFELQFVHLETEATLWKVCNEEKADDYFEQKCIKARDMQAHFQETVGDDDLSGSSGRDWPRMARSMQQRLYAAEACSIVVLFFGQVAAFFVVKQRFEIALACSAVSAVSAMAVISVVSCTSDLQIERGGCVFPYHDLNPGQHVGTGMLLEAFACLLFTVSTVISFNAYYRRRRDAAALNDTAPHVASAHVI
jgi:hypothetical protein